MEQERQEILRELRDEWEDYDDRFAKPGLGMHELADRASVLSDSWAGYILGHPACPANEEWFQLANEIMEKMFDFYQKVCQFEEEPEK